MERNTNGGARRSLNKLAAEEGISRELLEKAIEDGRLVAYRFGRRDLSIYDSDWERFREQSRLPAVNEG